ncbi:MAG TPA: hemolysin family protein [Candidatus Binataceae bacterium]|nr:hemolysin family protein [Candidatus Binataceae bacterium]
MAGLLLGVALLLLMSALLAASETALFALIRMEHTREQLSSAVRRAFNRLMERPLETLTMIIAFNEVCNVFAECLATAFLLWLIGPAGAWVSASVMLVVVLVFCDITPKTFALGHPAGVARITARPLAAVSRLTYPLSRRFIPTIEPPQPEPVSEEEFKALLRAGEVTGEVEPQERELINRVFDFGTRRVSEIMTPRDKIFAIDIDTPPDRLNTEVAKGHFSRVPIYRNAPDNIVGVLHIKDLVMRRLEPGAPRLARLVRPAYFVPPAKPLGELFDEMRRGRFQLALVVDEYGGLMGLITLEDLLEELFGEIRDEFDFEGPEIKLVGPGEWLVSGAIELSRLRETINDGSAFVGAGSETLSGLILRLLKRVPRRGEKIRIGNFELGIQRVRGATVEVVRMRR